MAPVQTRNTVDAIRQEARVSGSKVAAHHLDLWRQVLRTVVRELWKPKSQIK